MSNDDKRKEVPPLDDAAWLNRIVAKAYQSAEDDFDKNRASSQVKTHFLKMGSTREQLELEKLRNENLLLAAKIKSEEQMQKLEEMFDEVKAALSSYSMVYDD